MGSPKESNLKPSLPKLLKSTFKSFFISKNTGSNTAKRKIFGSKNVKSDPAKCDPIKSDPVKYDPVKSDPVKYDPVKSDPAKSEPVKIESPQRERLSADTLHTRKDTNKIKLDISKPHSPAVRIDSNESEKESNLAFGSRKSNKTDKQSHLTFASHRSINEKDTNDVNKNVDSDFTFSNTKIATKSQLSNDSGFGELASFADLKISPCVKNDDFLEETLKNLTLEGTCDETKNKKTHKSKSKKELNTKDDDKDLTKENEKEAKTAKKKHARTFYVRRGLTPHKPKHRQNSRAATDPYPHEITQINEKILSGGQMIIVSEEKHDFKSSFLVAPTWPDPSEIKINDVKVSLEIALNDAYSETQPVENADLDDCMKILNDKISPEVANELMQYAGMNVEQTFVFNYAAGFPNTANEVVYANEYEFTQSLSPQYDFSSPANDYTNSPNSALSKSPLSELSLYHMSTKEQFLTPPCSNESQTLHSPSQSYISPCTPPNLDAFSSPNHISSPEKTYMYTTILSQDGDATQIVIDDTIQDDKKDVRLQRGSSLNMSAIKKHLSMIAAKFAAKDCCQKGRKAPKDEMSEYLEKCTKEQRKAMCLNIARLEFDKLFDVLYFNILLALERPAGENDALNLSLFNLICQRLLAEKPEVFLHQNYGLALLVRASMRCPARPLLTRYLVWCVRCALRAQPARPGPVFTQTDSEGETLASALARRGDATADCLAELVARGKTEPPLFDLEHRNTEGYTALHVACQLHNAASLPTLHTVHALLAHGRAPRTLTDNKASNTPLHCAADSRGCELPLILTIFHDVPRTDWKPLAHAKNASQHTPLDVARAAFKSTSRPNYPKDVLEFLQRAARMP